MKRNCYLGLRLHPPLPNYSNDSMNEPLNSNQVQHYTVIPQKEQQCMLDITELQAKVIIWLASREMEERIGSRAAMAASSLSLQSQALMCGQRGLSMKRSLQTFLQKRKKRTQAHIPFQHPITSSSSSVNESTLASPSWGTK